MQKSLKLKLKRRFVFFKVRSARSAIIEKRNSATGYWQPMFGGPRMRMMPLRCISSMLAYCLISSSRPLPCNAAFSFSTTSNQVASSFVHIPAGTFLMGSNGARLPDDVTGGQGNRLLGDANERPALERRVEAFELATTEVTNAEYEKFDPSHRAFRGKLKFSYADDEAVVWVSWKNATSYAAWLSDHDPVYDYRLPTETEWEYACRAGTTTLYNTGDSFPVNQRKNNVQIGTKGNPEAWWPNNNPTGRGLSNLTVGLFQPNAWGLYDMHGNVEEWTSSIYTSYKKEGELIVDSVETTTDKFYVSRGGSHGTPLYFLRSSARFGSLPFVKNWLIGFRVARSKKALSLDDSSQSSGINDRNVANKNNANVLRTVPTKNRIQRPSDSVQPYFRGPLKYVNIPQDHESIFPFGHHNHDPAITWCPDGSLLAVFFSTWDEPDRECGLASSRLDDPISGTWSTPVPFYDTPGRLDTGPAFLWVENNTKLIHWVAVAPASTWGGVEVYQRESLDCGRTWSPSTIPEGLDFHGYHSPAETALVLSDGMWLLPTDDTGYLPQAGETAHNLQSSIGQISRFYLSHDEGKTWVPSTGSIRGHHGSFVELNNKSIWGIGRNEGIVGSDGLSRMPQGITQDRGTSFIISSTLLPNIHGGQRMVSLRLQEGPIAVFSFANPNSTDFGRVPPVFDTKTSKQIFGVFVALSVDEARSWEYFRVLSDGKPAHTVETTDGLQFKMDNSHGEPWGYLSAIQDPQTGIIHVISSRQHYQINLAWIKQK